MPVEKIFYDGQCGLCHHAVRFVLAKDRDGTAFRFAPLDSDLFRATVPPSQRPILNSSMVVLTNTGQVLTRSSALLHIWRRLGGIWRFLATMAGFLPRSMGDWLYDHVARNRHRLFAKPSCSCPVTPAHLRARFDV